jgi:carbon monoxide dehydrogenase subunit G
MAKLRRARTISVSIDAPAPDVYSFVSDPRRIPQWASGLGATPTPLSEGSWRIETPAGPMRVTFAPRNELGVVDHVVTPLSGEGAAVDVPLRVIPNGSGSEVMLTLFQQPGMSDAQFAADGALIEADLARLKKVIEQRSD